MGNVIRCFSMKKKLLRSKDFAYAICVTQFEKLYKIYKGHPPCFGGEIVRSKSGNGRVIFCGELNWTVSKKYGFEV